MACEVAKPEGESYSADRLSTESTGEMHRLFRRRITSSQLFGITYLRFCSPVTLSGTTLRAFSICFLDTG